MQKLKPRFKNPDGSKYGSLQSCIRTNDLDLVGDGSHLTYFEMLGNFSFGGNDYESSIDLWHSILTDLSVPVTHITCHPSQDAHRELWQRRGYEVKPEESCEWSDGEIGGYCCEVFVGELEIGNLVNPLGHSTDVGFGFERLHQVVENKQRVDETSLFTPYLSPLLRDHERTIKALCGAGIQPGSKGRNFICRRLLRRILDIPEVEGVSFLPWIQSERKLRESNLKSAKRCWRKFKDRDSQFWHETFGIMPEEMHLISGLRPV